MPISGVVCIVKYVHSVVASVNLDQIARDLDFNALQENLTNIAFCNIELELVRCIILSILSAQKIIFGQV